MWMCKYSGNVIPWMLSIEWSARQQCWQHSIIARVSQCHFVKYQQSYIASRNVYASGSAHIQPSSWLSLKREIDHGDVNGGAIFADVCIFIHRFWRQDPWTTVLSLMSQQYSSKTEVGWWGVTSDGPGDVSSVGHVMNCLLAMPKTEHT